MKKYLPVISSMYLAFAAMVMTWQTLYEFVPEGASSLPLLLFAGFCTFTAYLGYWYFTPSPIRKLHRGLLVIGFIGSAVWALFFYKHFISIGISVLCTVMYTAPLFTRYQGFRNIHWGKSILLAFIWTYSTIQLPLQLSMAAASPAIKWFTLHRFSLLLMLCIVFDIRDIERDRQMGAFNFLHSMKETHQHLLVYTILLVFCFSSWKLLQLHEGRGDYFIWLTPGLVLGAIYPFVGKIKSDWFYYLFIDGLMMLSGLLMILERF